MLAGAPGKGSDTMKIRCLACGHSMDLAEAYEDYEGQIKCWGCTGVLDVKLQEGKLRSMKFVNFARPSTDEALERKFA